MCLAVLMFSALLATVKGGSVLGVRGPEGFS